MDDISPNNSPHTEKAPVHGLSKISMCRLAILPAERTVSVSADWRVMHFADMVTGNHDRNLTTNFNLDLERISPMSLPRLSRVLVLGLGLALVSGSLLAGEKDDWVSLFDGKTLTGWEQNNGTATYRVEDGVIVGKTSEGSPNSFLCTKKDYSDFELKFEVKVDNQLNSGVQIRSVSDPSIKNGRVHGPQVEIATNGTAGFIYGEALGTGWLSEDRSDPKKQAAFKKGEWNKYRVKAEGKSIKTWVNGVPVADLVDEKSGMKSGFIGLQVHGIRKGTGPYEVRWRNLKLKDLSGAK